MTTKDFEHECFTPDKIVKYNSALARVAKGKPVIYFIAMNRKKGKPNLSHQGAGKHAYRQRL